MKDQLCRLEETCTLEKDCNICHLFEAQSGSEISQRPDKKVSRKYHKRRGIDDLKVNKEQFVNWNEDALYC